MTFIPSRAFAILAPPHYYLPGFSFQSYHLSASYASEPRMFARLIANMKKCLGLA